MDSGRPLFQVHAFLVVWLFLASTTCPQCCGNEAQIWSDVGMLSEGGRGDLHSWPREKQGALVSYRTGYMKSRGPVDAFMTKPEGN